METRERIEHNTVGYLGEHEIESKARTRALLIS